MPIHNEKRALHQGTGPLVYDATIEASAQVYADKMAASGEFKHDPENGDYGENLYYSYNSIPQGNEEECRAATIAW